MTIAAEILNDAQRRGVRVWAENGRLRYRAPRGTFTDELRSAITSNRDAVIAELARALAFEDAELLAARIDLASVRITSHYGDVWLARDEWVAAELNVEHPDTPVITFSEVPLLRSKSPGTIRTLLEVRRGFPRSRLIQ